MPAAFAEATPASVSSKTSVSAGSGSERVEREQVALRIGLAASHVVVGDDGREQLSEPGRGDDGNDLLARRAGDDGELRTIGGETDRVARGLGHRRPVRDRRAVAVDPLSDEGGDARVAGAEAQLGDRVLGEPGQALVVLTLGDRPAVLGEELAVDPAEDGLVLGERAVEVEDDRADRHVTREITLLCDAALRPPAGLAAALVHALWNLLLARARDPEAATAVALVVAVIVFAPVAVLTWGLEREVWPYLVVTSCLQLLYFALLITGYRKSEMSVVYPVARGVAPLIVLLAGIVVLGYSTSWAQAAGVVLVGLGVLAIRGVRRGASTAGVVFGLVIAAVIASYTLVDKRGLDYATPIAYLEVSMIAPALLYAAWVARLRGGAVALRSELNGSSVVAGIATFTAYALVLAALQLRIGGLGRGRA